jgi:hypothetical protein
MKNFIIGALIIGVAIVIGYVSFANMVDNAMNAIADKIVKLGASAGPDHYNMEYFYGGLVQGGDITAIASTTSGQNLTAAQLCNSAIITANISGAKNLWLPNATSIISYCLPSNGSSKTLLYRNINGTSASSTTWVATTNIVMVMPEASGADVVIEGGNSAWIRMVRTSASALYISITEFIDAD